MTNIAAATITMTATGRAQVHFADPVTGRTKLRRFRSERDARVFLSSLGRLARYWDNSITASVVADYAAGNVVTITAA